MVRRSVTWFSIVVLIAGLIAISIPGGAAARKADGADQGGRPFTTTLSGAEEAPGPGDPDGFGMALVTLNYGLGLVCWEWTVELIEEPRAAHIHVGPVGEPGPVVVALFDDDDSPGTGCIAADREVIRDIASNPGAYYVNVHNAAFPAGAVRGQLGD